MSLRQRLTRLETGKRGRCLQPLFALGRAGDGSEGWSTAGPDGPAVAPAQLGGVACRSDADNSGSGLHGGG